MKKKLALLLAAVMTMSVLPMSLFAASKNELSVSSTVVPNLSLLIEDGTEIVPTNVTTSNGTVLNLPETALNGQVAGQTRNTSGDTGKNDYIEYAVVGANLEIQLQNNVRTNDTFELQLENAVWFFRNVDGVAGIAAPRLRDFLVTYRDDADAIDDLNAVGTATDSNSATKIQDIVKTAVREVTAAYNAASEIATPTDNYTLAVAVASATDPALYASPSNFADGLGAGAGTDIALAVSALYNIEKGGQVLQTAGDLTFPEIGGIPESNEKYEKTSTAPYAYPVGIPRTYNTNRGVWRPNSVGSTNGTYERTPAVVGSQYDGIRYKLEVLGSNDSIAKVTFLQDVTAGTGDLNTRTMVIPLVSRTTKDADVRVIINSNLAAVYGTSHLYGIAGSTSTKTYVDDVKESRLEFDINKLVIKEQRLNSIKNGRVEISLPSGFEWVNAENNTHVLNHANKVALRVDPGLSFVGTPVTVDGTLAVNPTDYDLYYKHDGNDNDFSTLVLTLGPTTGTGVSKSRATPGALYITGLKVVADEDAKFSEIMAKIKNVTYTNGKVETVVTNEESVLVGKRVDWIISFYTTGTIPELINGRYEGTMAAAYDEHHKVAHVVFKENATSAWWSGKDTYIKLPEGVAFRKVEFTKNTNVNTQPTDDIPKKTFIDNGKAIGKITIDGRTMKWSTIKIDRENDGAKELKKAQVEFDAWVSIVSGYVGDVTMEASGSAIAPDAVPPAIVVAKQMDPITIDTKVTDIKIGYQYYQVADFTITETKVGALLKNRQVRVSISDRISQDMYFTPDFKYEKVQSNQKTTTPQARVGGSATSSFGDESGSYISFDIESASTDKPAVHKFTNVSVKIDRSVPESAKPYDLYVWGDAIAKNYNTVGTIWRDSTNQPSNGSGSTTYTPNADGSVTITGSNSSYNSWRFLDQFTIPGIHAPFIKVISAANDKVGVLSNEVKVTIGEKYIVSNGVTLEMDAEAYISAESNSTMVPLRSILNALGIKNEQIMWDNDNKTVNIFDPNGRVVQFQGNSDKMIINGSSISILSPDGLKVKAEIKGDRMYLPFRALGDAFGVPVTWDAATKTAIFNSPETNIGSSAGTGAASAATYADAGAEKVDTSKDVTKN